MTFTSFSRLKQVWPILFVHQHVRRIKLTEWFIFIFYLNKFNFCIKVWHLLHHLANIYKTCMDVSMGQFKSRWLCDLDSIFRGHRATYSVTFPLKVKWSPWSVGGFSSSLHKYKAMLEAREMIEFDDLHRCIKLTLSNALNSLNKWVVISTNPQQLFIGGQALKLVRF